MKRFTKKGLLKLLFSLSIMTACSMEAKLQPEAYSWHNVAMGGGGYVSGIITSKSEQGLVYTRTDVGGAYRWDAANNRWIPLLDWASENELAYMGVESIAIDPVEPNKVYMLVGTSYFNNGRSAILRSSDYGNTFAVTEVTFQFKAHGNGMGRQTGEKLMVDPNNPSILICGTRYNGVFKSSNAGVTWSRLTNFPVTTTPNENGVSFAVLDPSTGSVGNATQTIIAGVSRTGSANLYRSDDGGATFTAITGAINNLMPHRAVLASDRTLYITYTNNAGPWDITGNGAIWKYNLQTGAWTNVTPSPGGFTGAFGGISVDPANPARLVTSSINTWMLQDNAYGDRIFLSTDAGASWTDVVARGFTLDPNGSPWISGNSIHWAGSVEFDPFDTKRAWIISGNGVFRTDNIDATTSNWKFQVDGMEETVPLDVVSIPNGPLLSAIADYDGFRHTDVTQYAPIHEPRMGTTTGIAFASLNPKVMLRTGKKEVNGVQSGLMYYSNDMGLTWTVCTSQGINGNVAISADGKIFLHTPENSTTTYRSTDKGASWTSVTGLSVNTRAVADATNPLKFYAYNTNGSLMVSTDGGATFAAAGTAGGGGSKVIRSTPGIEGDIWIALNSGGLTRSKNSGQSFTKLSGIPSCSAVGFGKAAPGKTYPTIFIYGTTGGFIGVHRSTDEGATWTRVNDNAHEFGGPANGQFVVGDMNIFGRVYMSTAGRGIVYGESDSDNVCTPSNVSPSFQVNNNTAEQHQLISLDEGNTLKISPSLAATGGTWKWSGPSGFTSTAREITFDQIQSEQAGIYTVIYTNAEGCESAAQHYSVNVIAAITSSEEPADSQFAVYPNPVLNKLVINNGASIKEAVLLNSQGQKAEAVKNDRSNTIIINMEGFSAGFYILQLKDIKNISYYKRIFKY